VTPTRLDEEGFGAEHPVCPANDSEFCRAQNRRTAVHVTAK
jgi:K(+)-stimulated pyrophosphate-energized sodium pump